MRQARLATEPDPVAWALLAERAGAHGITCHLRKDRRHIQDGDVARLRRAVRSLLNLETSLDGEMVELALASGADAVCVVPENRREITTEGGLDVRGEMRRLRRVLPLFERRKVLVSLFVDPDRLQIEAAAEAGAAFVELHTGCYSRARGNDRRGELRRLREAAELACRRGLRVNAGHGLHYDNVGAVAGLPHVEELNIGHSIVSRALTVGVEAAVREMLAAMAARKPSRPGRGRSA